MTGRKASEKDRLADSRAVRRAARIKALKAEKQRLLAEGQAILRRRQGVARSGMDPIDFDYQKAIRDGYTNQRALLKVEVDLESAHRLGL